MTEKIDELSETTTEILSVGMDIFLQEPDQAAASYEFLENATLALKRQRYLLRDYQDVIDISNGNF